MDYYLVHWFVGLRVGCSNYSCVLFICDNHLPTAAATDNIATVERGISQKGIKVYKIHNNGTFGSLEFVAATKYFTSCICNLIKTVKL